MTTITAATAGATTGAGAATAAANPLASLSGNFNNFLNLLMTQLKNQDPSSPMDATTFTTQLVQFSSVEQQISTNSNLQTLIQATQSNTMLQSSALVGKQVTVTGDQLALQNGAATAHFTAPKAETLNVTVTAADGRPVLQTTVDAKAGNNDWRWDGTTSNGGKAPDGAYKIAVLDPSQTALPTTVSGTVTGVSRGASGVTVALGAVSADVGSVQSTAAQ